MRSSFLQKCQPKISQISALEVFIRRWQESEKFFVDFLENLRQQKDILELTDLYSWRINSRYNEVLIANFCLQLFSYNKI
jgi:hypothetical protein